MNLDVGCSLEEARKLNPELIAKCSEYMNFPGKNATLTELGFEDPFDLAVACAYDLEIVNEEVGYDIPVYLIQLAEEKMKE